VQCGRAGREVFGPIGVTDDSDGFGGLSEAIVAGQEEPAGGWMEAKDIEEIAGDDFHGDAVGGCVAGELAGGGRTGREALEFRLRQTIAEGSVHRIGEDCFGVVSRGAAG